MWKDKEIWPKWKKDQNSRRRTKQRHSQPIRWRVQNTGNQDAHRIDWFSHKMKEEMKAIQSGIEENIQGTNNEGKETGTQTNDLVQRKT